MENKLNYPGIAICKREEEARAAINLTMAEKKSARILAHDIYELTDIMRMTNELSKHLDCVALSLGVNHFDCDERNGVAAGLAFINRECARWNMYLSCLESAIVSANGLPATYVGDWFDEIQEAEED